MLGNAPVGSTPAKAKRPVVGIWSANPLAAVQRSTSSANSVFVRSLSCRLRPPSAGSAAVAAASPDKHTSLWETPEVERRQA